MGKYSKFILAVVGAIITIVAQQYGTSQWVQTLLPIATALGVYTVPNN